jgi:hypothetical protein
MTLVTQRANGEITFQITVRLDGTMLEMEETIQEAVNDLGRCVTEEALQRFDTDGSPIQLGPVKWTARSRDPKEYQTPYGPVRVTRYVYQTSKGGRIYCPLEHQARIIRDATPRFASQLSHKYGQLNVRAVQTDLAQNHGRKVATSYIQNVAEWVGSIANAKEESWEYEMPPLDAAITTVVVSLDGAMIPMVNSTGYREAMAGALSLYDAQGERQHTIYLAAAPEYGKAEFKQRLEREILRVKQRFPDALYLGIADGAATNWSFLEQHTQRQLIDFYHATEYLAKIAQAAHPEADAKGKRALWQIQHCHQLKHTPGAVDSLIEEAARLTRRRKLSKKVREDLESAHTYLSNHRHQMDYAAYMADGLPIGSGVTEAACKTLIKQRLCASGMRWKEAGAKIVLSLRALNQTAGRWAQFWQRIDQFGAECCC